MYREIVMVLVIVIVIVLVIVTGAPKVPGVEVRVVVISCTSVASVAEAPGQPQQGTGCSTC